MNFWATDESHDPQRTCWVENAHGHPDFPIQNLPFGVFSTQGSPRKIGVAIGDAILDAAAALAGSDLPEETLSALAASELNALFALPAAHRRALRQAISTRLSDPAHADQLRPLLHEASACTLHLPARIGDYTDFYVGIHHANNIGRQFRPDNPLLPNYKHIPIGYHGRASSVQPSGIDVRRPIGQRKPPEAETPSFEPAQRLDYELEIGVWIGQGNELGSPISISEAADHIAGFCLLNDWSARDFQAWEYQPLGPFLAKNFHSSVSPWVITSEAMAPYRIAQAPRPEGDPQPLPYLHDQADQQHGALSITLEVLLQSEQMRQAGTPPTRLSIGPASHMYWTVQQIVTHHASNGCNLTAGDLLGTGTISAPTRDGYGSLMELSSGGKEPFILPNGEQRGFLEDGDEIILKATAHAEGFASIGFGECRARILPAAG
jgi:fumarylacetoacetase